MSNFDIYKSILWRHSNKLLNKLLQNQLVKRKNPPEKDLLLLKLTARINWTIWSNQQQSASVKETLKQWIWLNSVEVLSHHWHPSCLKVISASTSTWSQKWWSGTKTSCVTLLFQTKSTQKKRLNSAEEASLVNTQKLRRAYKNRIDKRRHPIKSVKILSETTLSYSLPKSLFKLS